MVFTPSAILFDAKTNMTVKAYNTADGLEDTSYSFELVIEDICASIEFT